MSRTTKFTGKRKFEYDWTGGTEGEPRKRSKFWIPTPSSRRGRTAAAYRRISKARTGGFSGNELKYFDTEASFGAMVATWTAAECDPAANCLFSPTQGSGAEQRDGVKCLMKSIYITGMIRQETLHDQPDLVEGNAYAIALVLDTQTNKAQLNAEDVYDIDAPINCMRRVMENSERFKVLKTWQGRLPSCPGVTDGANTCSIAGAVTPFRANIKLNIPVKFLANAGTVADISDNSLHLIAMVSHNTPAAHVDLEYKARVRFSG